MADYTIKTGDYEWIIWIEGPEGKICDMAYSSLIEKGHRDGVEFMTKNAKTIVRALNSKVNSERKAT